MRCDQCDAPAMAVLPGTEPTVQTGIVVSRGEKRRAWCLACWPWLRPVAAEREA